MPQFLGFVTLGDTLVGHIVTKNSSGVPTNSDAAPTLRTYGSSGNITAGNVTASALDHANVTGLYSYTFVASAANGFASGSTYTIIAQYAISSTNQGDLFTFTVV